MRAPRGSGRPVLPLVVAGAAFLVFLVVRGYPWQLAALAAAAVGALAYVSLRTLQNMRDLKRTMVSPADMETRSPPPPTAGESNPGEPSR